MFCRRIGCNREAAYHVGFRAYAPPPYPREAVDFATSLEVCDYHREVSVAEIVTDDAWGKISAMFEQYGKVPPERASIEMILTPIEEEERNEHERAVP